jgi:hypothetical protein
VLAPLFAALSCGRATDTVEYDGDRDEGTGWLLRGQLRLEAGQEWWYSAIALGGEVGLGGDDGWEHDGWRLQAQAGARWPSTVGVFDLWAGLRGLRRDLAARMELAPTVPVTFTGEERRVSGIAGAAWWNGRRWLAQLDGSFGQGWGAAVTAGVTF